MEKGKTIIDYLHERKGMVPKTLKDIVRRFYFLLTAKDDDFLTGNRDTNSDKDNY